MKPLSIIIPAYNVSPYIAETLQSVFAQTFNDYEVIVVNDGSPDTVRLEQEIKPYLGRIRYLTNSLRFSTRTIFGCRTIWKSR